MHTLYFLPNTCLFMINIDEEKKQYHSKIKTEKYTKSYPQIHFIETKLKIAEEKIDKTEALLLLLRFHIINILQETLLKSEEGRTCSRPWS